MQWPISWSDVKDHIDDIEDGIDPKLLPNGGVGYSEDFSLTWDGNTEGRDAAKYGNIPMFYKVPDRILTPEELKRSTYVVVNEEDGSETILTGEQVKVVDSSYFEGIDAGLFTGVAGPGEQVLLASGKACNVDKFSAPSDGTYFAKHPLAKYYLHKLIFEDIHPIEPKYLSGVLVSKVIDLVKYDAGDGNSLNDLVVAAFAMGGATSSVNNTDGTAAFWRDISTNDNIQFLIHASNMDVFVGANSKIFSSDNGAISAIEASFIIPGDSTAHRVTVIFSAFDEMWITVVVEPIAVPGT